MDVAHIVSPLDSVYGHVLVIMNNAAVYIHESLCGRRFFISLDIWDRIIWLSHKYMFNIWRSCQTSQSVILHSYQQCLIRLVFMNPCQQVVLPIFLMTALCCICTGYLTEILICVHPVTTDDEHLSMCLLVILLFSLVECFSRSFAHFLTWLFFKLLNCNSALYILATSSLPDK